MVDKYTLHKDALDVKHAELITMAKSLVEWAYKHDSHSLNGMNVQAPKPTRPAELMLWGKFYSQNALGSAFSDAYQEYSDLDARLAAPW